MRHNFKCLSPVPTSVKMRSIRAVVLVVETVEQILLSHCVFVLCVSNKYLILIRNVTLENMFFKGKEV